MMTNNTPTTQAAPAAYATSELRFRNASNPRYRLDRSRPVKIYRNLSSKCFSVMQDSLVKAHVDAVVLQDVTWKVGQAGRLRVIREKQKNVHAFAVGRIVSRLLSIRAEWVHYNPYLDTHFNVVRDGRPWIVRKSAAAHFDVIGPLTLAVFDGVTREPDIPGKLVVCEETDFSVTTGTENAR